MKYYITIGVMIFFIILRFFDIPYIIFLVDPILLIGAYILYKSNNAYYKMISYALAGLFIGFMISGFYDGWNSTRQPWN